MKRILLVAYLLCAATLPGKAQTNIVAHAGFWKCEQGEQTMNSYAAFKAALDAGLYGVEMDVNMTKDGVLVVYHDGAAKGRCFNDTKFNDIKDKIVLKNGEHLPKVEDFLKLAANYPDTKLYIELKFSKSFNLEKKCVDTLLKLLKKYGLYDPQRVIPISFSANICKYLAQVAPEFRTQYITYNSSPRNVRYLGVRGVDYEYHYILRNPKYFENNPDLDVNVWTVDKDDDIRKLVQLGVPTITTNNPIRAMEIVKEENN